jgi:DNA-binding transcriptional regulator YhcF (GntR family)
LEVLGIVVKEQGRGTYISEQTKQLGDEYRKEELKRAVAALLREARQLNASSDEIREALNEAMDGHDGI